MFASQGGGLSAAKIRDFGEREVLINVEMSNARCGCVPLFRWLVLVGCIFQKNIELSFIPLAQLKIPPYLAHRTFHPPERLILSDI
jgi:hypothetical protein